MSQRTFGRLSMLLVGSSIIWSGCAQPKMISSTQPETPVVAKADPKEKEKEEEAARRAEFKALMVRGNTALADQNFDEAVKAYAEALKLFPENVDAARALGEARRLVDGKSKDTQNAEKLQADFDKLVAEGKAALAVKQYLNAVKSFEAALQLMPNEADTSKLLVDARAALAADAEQQKKLADYEKYMGAGNRALVAQRYPDAVREFTAALLIIPNDPAAQRGRRQAETSMEANKDSSKREADFTRLMNTGVAALKANQFDQAASAFQQALALLPDSTEAKQGLALAQQGMTNAKADYARLMTMADLAAKAGRYEEAVRYYGQVVNLYPNDETALKALAASQQFLANLQTSQSAYLRFMNQAALDMKAGRYEGAVRNYLEALRVIPNDANASAGLLSARAAVDSRTKNTQLYNQTMQSANDALRNKKYSDARKLYRDALQLIPDDSAATTGLRQSKYGEFMNNADTDMRAKRYPEAAKDYENALKEMPGDNAATNGLQSAKNAQKTKGK